MRRRGPGGAALAGVLLMSALLIVVCFSLATLSVLNLNMSRAASTTAQARALATAAVNQITTELSNMPGASTAGPLSATRPRVDLVERFKRPVFPSGAEHLPGTVAITFDPAADHASVDNFDSTVPAASWTDRGTARKSVPPLSLDVLMAVTVGGQTTWFEAVLQRRWPYVLCTPGRVTMMGTPQWDRVRPGTTEEEAIEPSHIQGAVFSLADMEFKEDAEWWNRGRVSTVQNNPLAYARPGESDVVTVGQTIFDAIFRFIPPEAGQIIVGGEIRLRLPDSTSVRRDVPVHSDGNVLQGRVDVMADSVEGLLRVAPRNVQGGGLRANVRPPDLQRKLAAAFKLPDPSEYVEVPPQSGVGRASDDAPPDESTQALVLPPNGVSMPAGGGSRFFALTGDLVLPPTGAALVKGTPRPFDYGKTARFVIPCSVGNRWLSDRGRTLNQSGAGIELKNCLLYVKGNLDLSASGPDAEGNVTVPALRGSNATIIVDGTLVLTNGAIDAQDQGMVIFCRRLVSQAKGHYKGLLLVQKSAAFFPAAPGDRLRIDGAIICGDSPIVIQEAVQATAETPSGGDNAAPPTPSRVSAGRSVPLRGLRLWSTELNYDPRYLKTLNPIGSLSLVSMRQVP